MELNSYVEDAINYAIQERIRRASFGSVGDDISMKNRLTLNNEVEKWILYGRDYKNKCYGFMESIDNHIAKNSIEKLKDNDPLGLLDIT